MVLKMNNDELITNSAIPDTFVILSCMEISYFSGFLLGFCSGTVIGYGVVFLGSYKR